MQSNRVLAYKKPSVYKAFLSACHHSHSIMKQMFDNSVRKTSNIYRTYIRITALIPPADRSRVATLLPVGTAQLYVKYLVFSRVFCEIVFET